MVVQLINAPKNGVIKAGTCVGVLYIETDPTVKKNPRFCKKFNGQWYCVHNGRLASDFRQGDKEVFIRHGKFFQKEKGTKNQGEIVDELRLLRNVQAIGVIAGESPCMAAHEKQPIEQTNTLHPDWCGAFAYKKNGKIIVSNGKYLFYTTNGERKCFLNSKNLQNSFVIHYLHYTIQQDSPGSKPYILEEVASRADVIAVIGLSSLPGT